MLSTLPCSLSYVCLLGVIVLKNEVLSLKVEMTGRSSLSKVHRKEPQ